ncbi:LPS export ABC transporter periplasmic protein LptC [Dactylococcopsis salina]|uniref:Organic solvent tolerance protein OstA n=1 Tax=Dactylococcopsis salina (strain PCC 8305) TaxID=13035 RepID=K9YT73_DACS8|nr:LPS export ABC transporter periplasmic protein LptC [Dactylococcopsis salina]AFZ50141.1 organic solvent tolerance protein OstA [Dactylococcopsis salina PCC 8305]
MSQKTATWALIGVLFLSLSACNNNQSSPNSQSESNPEEEVIEERLILENATLNQVNSDGETLWKLEVKKVVYRQNKEKAELEAVKGELYQDGNIFLQIEANQGEIIDNGKQINLQGEVVATDPRNGAVLKSEKLEWSPEDQLLVIPQPLTGSNPRFNVSADQGKYHTDQEELELIGNVEGVSNESPLRLKGKQLNWLIPEDVVQTNQSLQVDRYDSETETITDQVTANSGKVNLDQKMVFLKDNVEFKSSDPPLQAASNAITWDMEKKLLRSEKPIKVVQNEDKITLTGNQGQIDLETEIARFQGGVKGVSESNQAVLFANRLQWNLPTQEMTAKGDVIYQQTNPSLTSKGEEATGILQNKNIVVKGSKQERVTTEIVP